MAILVILLLVVLWAAVLVPPILRSRNQSSFGGVGDFMARLGSIGRHERRRSSGGGMLGASGGLFGARPIEPIAPPVQHMRIPGAMTPAQKRRRDVLIVLLGGVGFTFLLAIVGHSMALWFLQLDRRRAPRYVRLPSAAVQEECARASHQGLVHRAPARRTCASGDDSDPSGRSRLVVGARPAPQRLLLGATRAHGPGPGDRSRRRRRTRRARSEAPTRARSRSPRRARRSGRARSRSGRSNVTSSTPRAPTSTRQPRCSPRRPRPRRRTSTSATRASSPTRRRSSPRRT